MVKLGVIVLVVRKWKVIRKTRERIIMGNGICRKKTEAMSVNDNVYGVSISPETGPEKKGLGENFQVLM